MTAEMFTPLQLEAFHLAREIITFVKENRYKEDGKALAGYRQQFGDDARLQWQDRAGKLLSGHSVPSVGLYLDNSAWVRSLATKYTDAFAERVEAVRLAFVALDSLSPDEKWYTQCFMTEFRIRMVASYLVASAFKVEGIRLSPRQGFEEFAEHRSIVPLG